MDGFKTFLGIAISAAPMVATLFGFDTSPSFTGDATEIVSAIISVFGAVLAIYGRLVANSSGWFAKT